MDNRSDAEDLASEVFVRALSSRSPQDISAIGLLYRIAENLIIDHYRRASTRRKVFEYPEDIESVEGIHVAAPDSTNTIDIARGLACLTGEQYQVIVMRFLEGYKIHEVAEAMGKTVEAIKALQFRALQKMRNTLGELDRD